MNGDRHTRIVVILDPHSFTPSYVSRSGITHHVGRCDEALYVTTRQVTSSDLEQLRKRFHGKLEIVTIPGSSNHKAAFGRAKGLLIERCRGHYMINICWDEMAEPIYQP